MPHPGGRPPYKPTDAERAMVRNMAAAGLSQQTIQRCLPKAPKHPKTFFKAFRDELDTSAHLITAQAVSKLVAAMQSGEAWAICFWLKCKAGFQETAAHRLVDGAGNDIILSADTLRARRAARLAEEPMKELPCPKEAES